jgi:hypothetical protein
LQFWVLVRASAIGDSWFPYYWPKRPCDTSRDRSASKFGRLYSRWICFFSKELALDRLSQGRSGRVTTETNEFSLLAVSQFVLFRLLFFCASNRPLAKRKLLD